MIEEFVKLERRLPSIYGFRKLDRESDRVERRGDRVFLVDLTGRFDEPEVEVEPEEVANFPSFCFALRTASLEVLAAEARRLSDTPDLSEVGRHERLVAIRDAVAGRFPRGFFDGAVVPAEAASGGG